VGDKRLVTFISLTIALDGEWTKEKLELACLPAIRRACLVGNPKYAPDAWIDNIETKEMEIIPKVA